MGALNPGLSVEQAGDLMVLLAGHAPYRSLVQEDGWSMVEYKAWLLTTLVQQLLDAPPSTPTRSPTCRWGDAEVVPDDLVTC